MEKKSYPDFLNQVKRTMGALGRELQSPMTAFGQLHQGAMAEGALSEKVKELIALGVAIDAQCEACITYHVYGAMQAGASREEITEAIGVAVLMGGAPGVAHGGIALEALNQFLER